MTIIIFKNFYLLTWERERERKTLTCCSTYLCIHWLLLICALTRDQTHNPGVSGWRSKQLIYPARAGHSRFVWLLLASRFWTSFHFYYTIYHNVLWQLCGQTAFSSAVMLETFWGEGFAFQSSLKEFWRLSLMRMERTLARAARLGNRLHS